jgi:hypothetical protein
MLLKLEALGLAFEGKLTARGKYFIKGEGKPSTLKIIEPYIIHKDHFIASISQHADLS